MHMKKIILIVLSAALLLVMGIWAYLMIFGAPESAEELFADLGFDSTPRDLANDTTPLDTVDTGTQIDINSKPLQQLTMRPVAGAVIVGTSTTQTVRYVEQGIGHIYEIDLSTGNETRISGETFTRISRAVWSPNGLNVVLISEDTQEPQVLLGKFASSSTEFITTQLPPDAAEFGFATTSQELFYIRSDNQGSIGYDFNLDTFEVTIVASLPFIDPAVQWGTPTLVYTKPSELHTGYAYWLKNGALERASVGGQSLTAFANNDIAFVNQRLSDGTYSGTIATTDRYTSDYFGIAALPEKCAIHPTDSTVIFCAYPIVNNKGAFPNNWYKGKVTSDDYLWKVNLHGPEAVLLSDFNEDAGHNLDAINMVANYEGTRVTFIDKTSRTLWLYTLE